MQQNFRCRLACRESIVQAPGLDPAETDHQGNLAVRIGLRLPTCGLSAATESEGRG